MRMRQERRPGMILLLMGNPVQSCFLSVLACVFSVCVFHVNIKVTLLQPSERENEKKNLWRGKEKYKIALFKFPQRKVWRRENDDGEQRWRQTAAEEDVWARWQSAVRQLSTRARRHCSPRRVKVVVNNILSTSIIISLSFDCLHHWCGDAAMMPLMALNQPSHIENWWCCLNKV